MLKDFTDLINKVADLLSGGIATLLMTLAFIVFLLSVINFIWKRRSGEGKGLEQAGNTLWWSVFGLFVMVSIWGIVNFLATNLLGDDANKTSIEKPQTNFSQGASNNNSNNTTPNNTQIKKPLGATCSYQSECSSGRCKNVAGKNICD